jgi:hypothetical protein
MAGEKISQLPTVPSALSSDIITAIQGGVNVQETLQQVLDLNLDYIILTNAGDPNGLVAGDLNQICIDTTNNVIYYCSTSGSAALAVWTLIGVLLLNPVDGGTGVSSPTIHTIPIAQGSSAFHFLGLTNGQVLVGSTGVDPVPASLTAALLMVLELSRSPEREAQPLPGRTLREQRKLQL